VHQLNEIDGRAVPSPSIAVVVTAKRGHHVVPNLLERLEALTGPLGSRSQSRKLVRCENRRQIRHSKRQ
jgi:hypothetical protein